MLTGQEVQRQVTAKQSLTSFKCFLFPFGRAMNTQVAGGGVGKNTGIMILSLIRWAALSSQCKVKLQSFKHFT